MLDVFMKNRTIQGLLLALTYLILLLTSGLRYETGVDWRAYSGMVDFIFPVNKLGTEEGFDSVFGGLDIGFNLLISIIKFFGGGLQTLFFVNSFISTTFLTLSLKRYVKYPIVGLLIYYGMIFFYLDMSGMRQATSLSLFFFSIQYIEKKQPLRYFALLLVAFTFHWSILFLFPMYWLTRIKVSKALVATVLSVAVLLYAIGIKWLTSMIPTLFQLVQNTNFANKVVIYSTTDIFVRDTQLSVRGFIHIFLLIGMLILSEVCKKQLAAHNKYYMIFHKLFVIQILIYFTFYEFPEVAERIKLYFYVSNIVILVSFLTLFYSTIGKWSMLGFVFIYSLFYGNVHILEKPVAIAYFPYQNYLLYKMLGIESTGEQRLNQHVANTEDAVK